MLSKYAQFESVEALLQGGANPDKQNLNGDGPAHIAARLGNLEIVKILVDYDVRIGRRNWAELTPFGEARMNCHREVASFLAESFTPAELDESHEAKAADVTWDEELTRQEQQWEQDWDKEAQAYYFYNRGTGETSVKAPFLATTERVENLRLGADVAYHKRIAPVTGESIVGLSDYRDFFVGENIELKQQRKEHHAATKMQNVWRMRMSKKHLAMLTKHRNASTALQRGVRRFLGQRRREKYMKRTNACLVIQRTYRGYVFRKHFHEHLYAQLWWERAESKLNSLVTRVYRGHLYGRKPRRQLEAERDAANWGPDDWLLVVHNSGEPKRYFGPWEEYKLYDTVDVHFYRESRSDFYTCHQPEEWKLQDKADFAQREHNRLHGFTAEEALGATWLQKAWRGVNARKYFKYILKAQQICRSAEDAYLQNPDDVRCITNYVLFLHVIRKDYQRARTLYAEAIRTMEARGPDTQLLLYAFAVFCFVTQEDDISSILALVERANVAQSGNSRGLQILREGTHRRRNPKRFALAEAGFFRFAAHNIGDAESWHNYAACRHLVYGDFHGASDCYLRAIQLNPKDTKIQLNLQTLIDMFPAESQSTTSYEAISGHHMQQAEEAKRREDIATQKLLLKPEAKEAVLSIEVRY
ncbi:unnamed protein product, partial [Discosporangium mesarthrocarpum]